MLKDRFDRMLNLLSKDRNAAMVEAKLIESQTGNGLIAAQLRKGNYQKAFELFTKAIAASDQADAELAKQQAILAGKKELKAYQDRLMGLTERGLTEAEMAQQQYAPLQQGAQGLFGLGQQYLQQSPEQVAAQYMQQQQDLLAPSRERQYAQLQNQLFQTGRGGLSVGATGLRPSGAGGLGATTPEMEAYYNALAQQDLQLASQAQLAGQQNVAFGTGLLENPYLGCVVISCLL